MNTENKHYWQKTCLQCFKDCLRITWINCESSISVIWLSKTILRKVPGVQLRPVNPAEHVQNPSVGRHLALIQLGEHSCEQFVPKCPSSQARW